MYTSTSLKQADVNLPAFGIFNYYIEIFILVTRLYVE